NLTSSVAWTSADPSVATITASGRASGAALGTSQISATSGGVTGSTALTVGPAVVVSSAVSPTNPSIAKGTTQQFIATGTYSDGGTQDLSSSAAWASSNGAATITASGMASGAAQGSSQITASSSGVTGGTTLTVTPPALVSIAVTPSNPSIAKGNTQQFTATGTYSDGTAVDLTGSGSWVSSNPAVATISTSGLSSGNAQGSSQISAASEGVTGATTLTVGPA